MKFVAAGLLILLVLLQYRLWFGDGSVREVAQLQTQISSQEEQNARLRERNRTLAAEVQDLKKGTTAIEERVDSVRAGLQALASQATEQDWVLVHDAARPCLKSADLQRLIADLAADSVGGLLAAPVVDTLKRGDVDNRVQATVSRAALWRALTPQMFRYTVLDRALRKAHETRSSPTDEAQAVEALGLQPRLVPGDPDNIKITLPDDVERAARLLKSWSAA